MITFTHSQSAALIAQGNLRSVVFPWLLTIIAFGIFPVVQPVVAGTKTIVRSDYDKNEYVLVATTKRKVSLTSESESGVPSRQPQEDFNTDLTGVEGTASTEVTVGRTVSLPNPASFYAITGISIEEEWDKPCKMRLFGRLIDPRYQSEVRVIARLKVGNCRWSLLISDKVVNVAHGTPDYFDFTKQGKHFVSSIRVCNGQTRFPSQFAYSNVVRKIKGLKAQAAELKLIDSIALKSEVHLVSPKIIGFKRTNCPDVVASSYVKPGWQPWHECPPGQIATSVTAYHYEDKWLTGFSLGCQSVSARHIASPPVKDDVGY